MAQATIIPATMSIYAPRANLPIMALPPSFFLQNSQGRPGRATIVNFWLIGAQAVDAYQFARAIDGQTALA
jgi:hypothetical protein